jgi:hypothetical protein
MHEYTTVTETLDKRIRLLETLFDPRFRSVSQVQSQVCELLGETIGQLGNVDDAMNVQAAQQVKVLSGDEAAQIDAWINAVDARCVDRLLIVIGLLHHFLPQKKEKMSTSWWPFGEDEQDNTYIIGVRDRDYFINLISKSSLCRLETPEQVSERVNQFLNAILRERFLPEKERGRALRARAILVTTPLVGSGISVGEPKKPAPSA